MATRPVISFASGQLPCHAVVTCKSWSIYSLLLGISGVLDRVIAVTLATAVWTHQSDRQTSVTQARRAAPTFTSSGR